MNDLLTDHNDNDSFKTTSEEAQTPNPINAIVHVSISRDMLKAYLNIEPPLYGGSLPTLEEIKNELSRFRINYGIDEPMLLKMTVNPIYNCDIQIAEGLPSVKGTDGTYTLQFNTQKEFRPKERLDGTVDYQDLGLVENVKKGQVLCSITKHTNGEEGKSVTGAKIFPVRGKPVPITTGKNTEYNENGDIIAMINGQVELFGTKINVDETFIVQKDVDISTGNIKVNGNVKVNGTVVTGFTVEAAGNIEIKGTVAAVMLKAGGNITLHGGAQNSELVCDGDLNGRFIENCAVTVKGSAKLGYVMNSKVQCGQTLTIAGPLARFSGGSCTVGQDIIAPIIGFPSGIITELELGTDPQIIERQQQILHEIPRIEKQLQCLEQLIPLLRHLDEENRLDDDKKQKLKEALNCVDTNKLLLESDQQELEKIHELLRTKGYGRIICSRIIHPGTKIKIGDAKLSVTESIIGMTLYNDEGEICQVSCH